MPEENGSDLLPILFVPGLSSSQLEARCLVKKDNDSFLTPLWQVLWLNMVLIFSIDYVIEKLTLFFNAATGCFVNKCENLSVRPYKFGKVDGIKTLNPFLMKKTYIFGPIISFLEEKFGYKENINMYGAPYDFRKLPNDNDLNEYFQLVENLIIEMRMKHNKPVIIICHSLGGLLMMEFLSRQSQKWLDFHVDSWTCIATPFGGCVFPLKSLLFGAYWDELSIFYDKNKFKNMVANMSSLYYTLPTKEAFGENYVVVKIKDKEYTVGDYEELFELFGIEQYKKLTSAMPKLTIPDNIKVDTLIIYGNGTETPKRLIVGEDKSMFSEEPGNGDGTVNIESLSYCSKLKEYNPDHVCIESISNKSHHKILKSKKSLMPILEKHITKRLFLWKDSNNI